VQRTRAHLLADILIIGILSVIAGARDGRYGNLWFEQTGLVKTVLALPNGIPCPDTFRRVFERINPKVFERCFQRWVQSMKHLGHK